MRPLPRSAERLAFPVAFLALLVAILVSGGFVVTVALPNMLRTGASGTPAPGGGGAGPSGSPQPSSAMALSAIGIAMPPNADCMACHTISTGGVGTKPIPYLGHPLQGFTNCTACHNPTGLVKTAPGHSSLHASQCLICHQENPNLTSMSQVPARPEHMTGEACTDCHNPAKHAPLPSNMANRGDNCWICHNGPEFQYLFASPSPSAGVGSGAPTPAPAASGAPAPSGSPAPAATSGTSGAVLPAGLPARVAGHLLVPAPAAP